MGIIKKQSIQSTLVTYIGVVIGFVNAAVLLPLYFEPKFVGLLGFLNSLTSIISTFAIFGVPLITTKLFPYFRSEEKKHNGFFSFIVLASIIGIGFGILGYFIFKEQLISEKNAARTYVYFSTLFCIVFASRVIFKNFDSYVKMLYKTVLGTVLDNIVVKGLILITLYSWVIFRFDLDLVFILYSLSLGSAGIFLLLYVSRLNIGLNYKQFRQTLEGRRSELYTIGFFGIVGGLGSIIVMEVDRMMVSNMIGLEATGVYSVAFFFGLFVSIPARGLRRIASVVLSEAWKTNDLENITDIYRKSCSNQLLISGYLFLGIWFCVPYLLGFMRPEYAEGINVILFIGLAQVIDMITGVNGEIIITSKYYKYNTYFIGVLIVGVIILNYLFIPIWGIDGAAAASLIAMTFINLLRYIFLYYKFGFQPFTLKILWNLLIMGAIFTGMSFMPKMDNGIIGILVSGGIVTIAYWIPAYKMNISKDVNSMLDKTVKRFIKRN